MFRRGLEEIGRLALGDEDRRVIGGKPILAHESGLLGVRHFRQIARQRSDEGVVELERQQIGIGEIAIVVRLFLRAHRTRLAACGIEEARLLLDLAAILDDGDLTARFRLDRLADEADRVDVLDLAARVERRARPPHRNIDVGAQVALLHVAVARADIAQDRAQLQT